VWRAWTIPLVVRMSLTWESVTGKMKCPVGTKGLMTSEGVRVESRDGEASRIMAVMTPGVTFRS